MTGTPGLFAGRSGIPWQLPDGVKAGIFTPQSLHLGKDQLYSLEVAVATAEARPGIREVRDLWKRRRANRPAPLLLVIAYPTASGTRVALCGPAGDDPPVVLDGDPGRAERVALAALEEPNRTAAIRFLTDALAESDSDISGLRNSGMFATHELRERVPTMAEWATATTWGRTALHLRGRELVATLGFDIEGHGIAASILRVKASGTRTAVAVFLEENESPDGLSGRFGGNSPISHALAQADVEQLPYVVLTRGPQIRVYSARHRGVGRKGREDTFIEANLTLLPDDLAGYLPLLFGAQALAPAGTFEAILEQSQDYATGLGERLRDRVYADVVPVLAAAVAAHHRTGRKGVTEQDLADLYETTMVILFRLLFVAYAEDKDLLPYRTNEVYRQRSLKTLARDLADRKNRTPEAPFDEKATDLWERVRSLWKAVDQGHTEWGVPPYDGGLFSSEAIVSPVGARLAALTLSNAEVGPALQALLVDEADDRVPGPVDFRALSVREFGTIYEGLLESNLSVAPSDLTVGKDGAYVPARVRDSVAVPAGGIYLHNRSGARKASGSYFTKPFAVEHLLDHALEPALDDHLARLEALVDADDQAAAAEAFFDFRVADIAMGSGHFLVAAVDRIEARLSAFLTRHNLPGVANELERLRQAALGQLGELGAGLPIEQAALLRRQVARRCIYGVDLNLIAVELARLSIWIHTFVPGLPLSFLDHNLVQGNSLTGIGTLDEALYAMAPDAGWDDRDNRATPSLMGGLLESWLGRAGAALQRLGRISDADAAEIEEARQAHAEALAAVEPARRLFNLLVGVRLGTVERFERLDEATVERHPKLDRAATDAEGLQALHFPVAFPEVFARERSGFDCLLGNPPWDKVRYEAQQFWVAREPGLNALPAPQRDRRIEQLRREMPVEAVLERKEQGAREQLQEYYSGAFRLQGRGHLDLAKLFVERALGVVSRQGSLGYVLPRQCLVLGGWEKLRRALMSGAETLAFQARNTRGWLFDDTHHSFMVVLLCRLPAKGSSPVVRVWGAAKREADLARTKSEDPLTLDMPELGQLSDTLVVPWLNDIDEAPIVRSMLLQPRLRTGRGWVQGISETRWDFSGSGRQKAFARTTGRDDAWRVLMARHVDHFGINRDRDFERFIPNPQSLASLGLGVVAEHGKVELAAAHPALVFRYPSRSEDARTMIPAPLPHAGFLPSTGYVHAVRHERPQSAEQTLGLLAYLGSFTCDWWVRRFVDRHVTAPVVNNLPLPQWSAAQIREASTLAGELAVRRGCDLLPGRLALPRDGRWENTPDDQLAVEIEKLVLDGFGLDRPALQLMLEDFSDTGCPDELRRALLERMK